MLPGHNYGGSQTTIGDEKRENPMMRFASMTRLPACHGRRPRRPHIAAPALLIVNPAAGDGRTRRLWPSLRDVLTARRFAFEMVETRARGDAATLAADAARAGVSLVVAVGGDGTLNEVVNGLAPLRVEHEVTVGALLTGRGRDAGRNLGLARNPRRAARRLADGHVVALDLGLARWPGGHRYFLGCAGTGFDAVVVRGPARAAGG